MEQQHANDEASEAVDQERQRQSQAESCRLRRREMLTQWDVSEETLVAKYETTTVAVRQDLNRLAAIYRRKVADERKGIEQKVEAHSPGGIAAIRNREKPAGDKEEKRV